MLFRSVSERPGGQGKGDIWVSTKSGSEWSEPVNMGVPVNSSYDENGLYLTPDGNTLFFCSNGPTSMGSYDIFRTIRGKDGKWSAPVNVGYPINSVGMESKFVMTVDNKTAYISTVRDSGLGERDIMKIDISNYNVLTGESTSSPKKASLNGKIVNSEGAGISVEIRILDKATGVETAMTKSGLDGSFSIDFSGDTNVTLEISAEGFQRVSEPIQIPSGKTQSKNITLMKNN